MPFKSGWLGDVTITETGLKVVEGRADHIGLHSLMAEALIGRIDSEHFQAVSASTSRARLRSFTVKVMEEIGIDVSQNTPKHMKELDDNKFDYVITLDDNSARVCRNFQAETIHWKLDDPVGVSSDPERQLRTFRSVRDQISHRLRLFAIVHCRPQTHSLPAALVDEGNAR